jgi:outer membrane lipoprotein SlyB
MAAPAEAKGCIKGALVGGVAGHVAHHAFLGAVTGCIAGHHLAKKRERELEMQAPVNGSTAASRQQ